MSGYSADTSSPPDPTANIPQAIKLAIKRTVATHYEHREDIVVGQNAADLPMSAKALLAPYRVW